LTFNDHLMSMTLPEVRTGCGGMICFRKGCRFFTPNTWSRTSKASDGRNPATSETIQIAAAEKLTFAPAKTDKEC
jgi:hypothetical protein